MRNFFGKLRALWLLWRWLDRRPPAPPKPPRWVLYDQDDPELRAAVRRMERERARK